MKKEKKELLTSFNKKNILNTAKKLFQENGIEKTTMDDIAKHALCSKSTIYVYFKSKEEIYYEIIYEYFNILKKSIEKTIKKDISFKESYYEVCYSLLEFKKKHPMYFEITISNISVNENDFKKYEVLKKIYDTGEETNMLIKTALEKGIKEKYVRKDININDTIFFLLSTLSGLIITAYNKKEYFTSSLNMDIDMFLRNGFDLILKSIS